jgi:hypothetical protein
LHEAWGVSSPKHPGLVHRDGSEPDASAPRGEAAAQARHALRASGSIPNRRKSRRSFPSGSPITFV